MGPAYEEYEWYLRNDLKAYAGKWVAISGKKVAAASNSLSKVLKEFRKTHPGKTPLIVKIN